jgi:hypothetical protein
MNTREIILQDVISRAKYGKDLIKERKWTAIQYAALKNAILLSYGAIMTSAVYIYLKRHTRRQVYVYSLFGCLTASFGLITLEKEYKPKVIKQLGCDEEGLDDAVNFYRYAFTDRNHFYETNNKH